MASINEVTIDLKFTGLNNLEQATKKMRQVQTEVKRLANEEKAGAISADQYSKRVSQLASELQKSTKGNIAARNAVNTYSRAVRDSIAATEETKRVQQEVNAIRQRNATIVALQEQRLREEAKAEAAANAERQRTQQSYRQLKLAIDPVYASQQRLTQGVQAIRAAQRAGIITTQEAITSLRQLRAAQDAAAQGSQFASRGLNRMGVVVQQAGYQVGDFFVQIQSGTNAMVAFGQQATQLVGTFAMFARTTRAAMIASGIGIFVSIATAVGAAIMRMNGQMDTLDTKVQKMTSSFDDLNTSMDRLEDADLDQTFGDLTGEIESITESMVSLNNAAALNNLMSTFEKLEGVADAGFFRNVGEGFLNIGRFINPFAQGEGAFGMVTPGQLDKEAFAKLGYDMSREQYLAYLDGLQNLVYRGDIEGVTSLIATFFQDATDGAAQVSMEGMAIAQSMETAAIQAAKFAARQNGSVEAARLRSEQIEELIEAERLIGESLEGLLELQIEEAAEKAARLRNREIESLIAAERLIGESMEEFIEDQNEANRKLKELTVQISAAHQAYIPLSLAARNAKSATEEHASEMISIFEKSRDLREELGDAAYEALRLAGVDMTSGVDAAAKAAARLAADLNISLAAALAMQGAASKEEQVMSQPVVQGKITDRYGVETLLGMGYTEEYLKFIGKIRADTSGGGAAGSSDNLRQSVDQLIASYDEQYAKSLKVAEATKLMAEAQMAGAIPANMSADKILQDYIASLEDADDTMSQFVNDTASQMSDAFMSIVDGSKSASDAFGDMARAILKQAFELAVINPIINSIFGGVSGFNPLPSLVGSANGNVFSDGRVVPFANGGVVSSPTMFPMRGAQAGLMGEAGPEAIMPLKRGKGGKLGVVAEGASQPVVIHQNFNFSANGDDSVKRIIAQEAPKIASLTQKQILDQRARGGAFKTTFG
jgi:lambda family phage tail tape measure protein